jgi:hypothetical protein
LVAVKDSSANLVVLWVSADRHELLQCWFLQVS